VLEGAVLGDLDEHLDVDDAGVVDEPLQGVGLGDARIREGGGREALG